MDKFDLLAKMIEYPENYSEEELDKLLCDPEIKGIYELHCRMSSAEHSREMLSEESVNEHWRKFKRTRSKRPVLLSWFWSRAASVGVIVVVSVMAIAAVSLTLQHTLFEKRTLSESTDEMVATSSTDNVKAKSVLADSIKVITGIEPQDESVIFENEPLEVILTTIATANGVKVDFKNQNIRHLRLYFVWDKALTIDEVMTQLNHFEQINIAFDGAIIEVK